RNKNEHSSINDWVIGPLPNIITRLEGCCCVALNVFQRCVSGVQLTDPCRIFWCTRHGRDIGDVSAVWSNGLALILPVQGDLLAGGSHGTVVSDSWEGRIEANGGIWSVRHRKSGEVLPNHLLVFSWTLDNVWG